MSVKLSDIEDKEQFLNNLVHLARTCGWSMDYSEVSDFVRWCYDYLGESNWDVNLRPYEDETSDV